MDENVTHGRPAAARWKPLPRSFTATDVSTRFRPSFFPFTEPSAEVDLTCCRLPRQGLPHLQGHRLDRSAGLRHGQPQGAGNVRHRQPASIPALPSASAWSASPCKRYGITDMRLLYEGDAASVGTASLRREWRRMKLAYEYDSGIRGHSRHVPRNMPSKMIMSGTAVEGVEDVGRRHGQGSRGPGAHLRGRGGHRICTSAPWTWAARNPCTSCAARPMWRRA